MIVLLSLDIDTYVYVWGVWERSMHECGGGTCAGGGTCTCVGEVCVWGKAPARVWGKAPACVWA